MAYLVDIDVVSELGKRSPNAGVLDWWADTTATDIYLSVLTLGEIRRGIEQVRPKDPTRAASFDAWLLALASAFASRTISVDVPIADQWGCSNVGGRLPDIDGLLAATALVRGWTLVTRNVEAVARTGVALLNPFT